MRIALFAQHLSGVGHYVRTHAIACRLAPYYDTLLVEGGRPVPRRTEPEQLKRLELPRIVRGDGGLVPLESGLSLDAAMARRADLLHRTIAGFQPDVVMIEHYPFSKWQLADEFTALIGATRAANPRVRIVCSARDVLFQTRHEQVSPAGYRHRVCTVLNEQFDLLIVHGDEALIRLEESFGPADGIRPPVRYSGIVCEDLPVAATDKTVLLSVGGGAGHAPLVDCAVDAWRAFCSGSGERDVRLLVFAGLDWPAGRLRELQERGGDLVAVRPFSTEFPALLAASRFVICHAGYNTCAGILQSGARALLIPDPRMSDQALRARRLAELGIVRALDMEHVTVDALAAEMRRLSGWTPAPHRIDLDGAKGTRRILEELAGEEWT